LIIKEKIMNDFYINSLFKSSWNLYKERFWNIFGIALLPGLSAIAMVSMMTALFLLAFTSLIPAIFIGLVAILLFCTIGYWLQAALYEVIINDSKIGIKESLKNSKSKFLSLLWINFLAGLITMSIPIIVSIVIAIIGNYAGMESYIFLFPLIIIPVVLFGVWFSLSPFLFFKEGIKGMSALKRSRELVKGNFGKIFWRLLVIGIFLALINFILSFIPMLGGLINIAIIPFGIVFTYMMYKELSQTTGIERSADNMVFESQEKHQL